MLKIESHDQILMFTVDIVIAHVGHNDTPAALLPGLISDIYETLASIEATATTSASQTPIHRHEHDRAPAHAAPGHSVSDDLLVCLEDGFSMKMLKRHLLTVHGLTPDQYRAKWGLPHDYPMVAANYAKLRSTLAKQSGLGLRPEARPKRRRV